MGNQLIVNLPDDLKQRLKVYCSKNGTTMSDEVTAMLCQKLAEEESGQKAVAPKAADPQTVVSPRDLFEDESVKAEPFDADSFRDEILGRVKDELVEKLSPLLESLRTLQNAVRTVDSSGLNAFVADQNKKNSAIANFLEDHIKILEKTSSAKRCDDDIKGLELLRKEFKV